jgi:glycosyltransferase involved in cell wall biosynthesis
LRKLLFIVNADWAFLSHRLPIAESAIENGYEVHIITPITRSPEIFSSSGLIVHPLYLNRKSFNPFSNFKSFLQMYSLIKRIDPDILHVVTIKPILLGGIAARLLQVPGLVIAISGLGFVYISKNFFSKIIRKFITLLYKFIFSHPNIHVIFQNKDDLTLITKITKLSLKKTSLIPGSGVLLKDYPACPLPHSDKYLVVMAARLLVDKGVREFANAARQLHDAGYQPRFILVGDYDPGNPANISKKEVEQWVSEGILEYWGYQNDIPSLLARSYMVVLPSYREGLPKILIEAAACARAVITTDVPGCREAIDPNITGILVPPRDSYTLALAIKQLLDDHSLCEKMGLAGRKRAETCFDIKQVIGKHIAIYAALAQQSI